MRTTFSPALRSILIFSTELVLGPIDQLLAKLADASQKCRNPAGKLTNCTNDRGTTIVCLWLELGVQAGEPFDLGASAGQVIQ